ncbi:phosphate transport regulator [Metallosphaera hakonensis]|uniref:Phosphate transport regulator n=1 Tax=Metallosphaera hakonensis JCM 8857 = DSM 7519 TaxID=1293036 RepID=A0A2U9IU01_9CREN|nr:phosphate transport regulator [Metallosphaera hakonensis]AWR99550.1 phosphate transport regulator [Metallosphaera hakonensis JCM 8857 = DSM 7519]
MSIAHMNLEERLQQISLKVIDQVRTLYELMKSGEAATPMQVYSKINGIKNSVEMDKFMLGEYIIRIKEGIQDKDLYIDVLNNLEKISQNLDAASYRLSVLISRGTQIDELLYKLITIIAEKLLASLTHLVESLRLLSINAQKSVESARNIMKLEEEVDDLYRSLELKLFEKKYDDLIYVMLMKDVADRLEDSEDMIRDSATSITYIAFGRL